MKSSKADTSKMNLSNASALQGNRFNGPWKEIANAIAKLRAFVEEVAKYDTRRGAGGWNFPTERALKAQQLLKELDEQ